MKELEDRIIWKKAFSEFVIENKDSRKVCIDVGVKHLCQNFNVLEEHAIRIVEEIVDAHQHVPTAGDIVLVDDGDHVDSHEVVDTNGDNVLSKKSKLVSDVSDMVNKDLSEIIHHSEKLRRMIAEQDELDDWMISKMSIAANYIHNVYHALEYKIDSSKELEEMDSKHFKLLMDTGNRDEDGRIIATEVKRK